MEHPMPNNEYLNHEITRVVCEEIAMRLGQSYEIRSEAQLQSTLGMSSHEVVELIVVLNERFQVDAFEKRSFTDLRTVGDLCKLYRDAVLGIVGDDARETAVLLETTSRARTRRARPNVHRRQE